MEVEFSKSRHTTKILIESRPLASTSIDCLSILHPPGNDPLGYESSSERWSPVQSIEKILLSVMSMLAEPNTESPANVDAAKMWREDRPAFKKKACLSVRKSLDMV